jgi:hypothetical protein
LVRDEDILKSTAIDMEAIAAVVLNTGAVLSPSFELFSRTETEKTVVDIGVLRYPDPSHPYFNVR